VTCVCPGWGTYPP